MITGPTPKYRGDADPRIHGGGIQGHGPRGYPVRASGPLPPMRDAQYRAMQATFDFKAKEFRTWEPESVAEYLFVMDRVANRSFILRQRLQQYDEAKGGWRFWVEWFQVYEAPASRP